MQKKRFIARDMQRAIEMVKDEFGEDAMIISTGRTDNGVELIAGIESYPGQQDVYEPSVMSDRQQQIANAASGFRSRVSQPFTPSYATTSSSSPGPSQLSREIDIANKKMLAARSAQNITLGDMAEHKSRSVNEKHDEEIRSLHNEINEMRSSIESHLSSLMTYQATGGSSSPAYQHIRQQMDMLALTRECQDSLIKTIHRKKISTKQPQKLWTHVMAELAKAISVSLDDPVSQGGQYIFLGTTGVGKTTTIAKLAARHVMAHGASDIVILSTDNYRLASHDQLKSLSKILGVEFQVVSDLRALPDYLNNYRHYSLVLIDTPGMSPADPMWREHLGTLRMCESVEPVLVLAASSQYQIIKSSLLSYSDAKVAYGVVTKIDECSDLGSILSLLYFHDLSLAYVSNGQAVPDDLLTMKSTRLISTALGMAKKERQSITSPPYKTRLYR